MARQRKRKKIMARVGGESTKKGGEKGVFKTEEIVGYRLGEELYGLMNGDALLKR
jgi:hypothetical protein